MTKIASLRGLTWDHPRAIDGLNSCAPEIESQLSAKVDWATRSLLAFGDQHISEFASDFDLLVIDHPHVPDAVNAHAVLPLDELLKPESLLQIALESVGESHNSYSYRGKTWALAIDTAAQVSVYREGTVGVPLYWADVLSDARSDKVLWPYKPVDAFSTFATLMAQLGKPLLETTDQLNAEAATHALELMVDLAAHTPEICGRCNPVDVAEMLSTSTDYDYAPALYGYSNYSRVGFRPYRLHYEDIVSFDGKSAGSQLGGAGIAVSSATKHPELAAAIAAYLTLAHAQAGLYSSGGGQPGNLRAWRSPELNELTAGFFRNTLRTLERAWVRPRILGYPDYQLAVSQIIHSALVARRFSKKTVSEIQAQAELYLREVIL
jgi:multiple sugar transport system substrate-binding protein